MCVPSYGVCDPSPLYEEQKGAPREHGGSRPWIIARSQNWLLWISVAIVKLFFKPLDKPEQIDEKNCPASQSGSVGPRTQGRVSKIALVRTKDLAPLVAYGLQKILVNKTRSSAQRQAADQKSRWHPCTKYGEERKEEKSEKRARKAEGQRKKFVRKEQ
jgi:hypothetical protein